MASIFSQIVNGEVPAAKVYEDDKTLAFLDIRPAARGHTLVICKDEHPSLLDVPPDVLSAVAHTTQRVARAIKEALHPDGFNVVQNDGPAAGQVVFHYHVHIIPRWEGDKSIVHWIQQRPDQNTLNDVATLISGAIND
jgi:histidine triad (HIT) family protein